MKILQQLRKKYIFYLLPVFLCFSCGSRDVFNVYVPVDSGGWHADSICVFTFHISDSTALYDARINIRHTGDYPYRDLWLMVQTMQPDSTVVQDTTKLVLATPTGKWYGAGSSPVRHFSYLYKKQMKFAHPGDYQVSIRHGMQDSTLYGIVNTGIRIAYSE